MVSFLDNMSPVQDNNLVGLGDGGETVTGRSKLDVHPRFLKV